MILKEVVVGLITTLKTIVVSLVSTAVIIRVKDLVMLLVAVTNIS